MALRLMSREKENEAKTDRTTEEKHELSSYAHSYDRKSIELPDNQNRAPTRSRSIFPGRGRIKFENFN